MADHDDHAATTAGRGRAAAGRGAVSRPAEVGPGGEPAGRRTNRVGRTDQAATASADLGGDRPGRTPTRQPTPRRTPPATNKPTPIARAPEAPRWPRHATPTADDRPPGSAAPLRTSRALRDEQRRTGLRTTARAVTTTDRATTAPRDDRPRGAPDDHPPRPYCAGPATRPYSDRPRRRSAHETDRPRARPPIRPTAGRIQTRPKTAYSDRPRRPPFDARRPYTARPNYDARPIREPVVDRDALVGEGEELIAGRRPVEEAFAARREAFRLLIVPERRAALDALAIHATTLRIPVVEVEGGSLTALAGFDGHQGVALVARPRPAGDLDRSSACLASAARRRSCSCSTRSRIRRTSARCCAALRRAACTA